jgi:hypothetical protein
VPLTEVPALSTDDMMKLVGSCDRSSDRRRDAPILGVLTETGLPLRGLSSRKAAQPILLNRKAHLVRWSPRGPFGPNAAKALDRYCGCALPAGLAHLPDLWPASRAGLHPRMVRHTFVDQWLRNHRAKGSN